MVFWMKHAGAMLLTISPVSARPVSVRGNFARTLEGDFHPDDCKKKNIWNQQPGKLIEKVPIFLKFHKVGSTALTTMLQSVCHIKWWNATSSKAPKSVGAEDFCCGDPFWHQTIHQYRSTGVCSLQRCTLGFDRGLREPKLVALFRDPVDRFISGVYYFARWEARAKLFSTPPKNFSLAEFDRLAHLSLQVF